MCQEAEEQQEEERRYAQLSNEELYALLAELNRRIQQHLERRSER